MIQRKIQILDEITINQIAAGEVIENPASIVKELVENSIDAGASTIKIETQAGGRGGIKIVDDGIGMDGDELLLAIERHATSKLLNVKDFDSLATLGFRGEALPSIAAVSKMTLHSATQKGKGSFLRIEGGKVGSLVPLPRQQGTTIEVKSLFFNVPVRKRFQKSAMADSAEIHKLLIKFSLGYPKIGFSWMNEGKEQCVWHSQETFDQRIGTLFGKEWAEEMLLVEHALGPLNLKGRISRPHIHRPHRSGQYLFVNQRATVSPWIAQKVVEGYGNRLNAHRYPLFAIHLTLPPLWVDVNVHPQKREVRFREEERLASFILEAIHQAFDPGKNKAADRIKKPPEFPPQRTSPQLTELSYAPFILPKNDPSSVFQEERNAYSFSQKENHTLFEEKLYTIVGKVKHYFFVEELEGIRLVDGLRATERIVYEKLCVEPGKQEIQSLLIPIQISMKGDEKVLLFEHLEAIQKLGIGIRHFGGDTFLVDAIPVALEPEEINPWIDLYLKEGQIPLQVGKCLRRGSLSFGAGPSLIKQLFLCKNPNLTPSGKLIHCLLDSKKLEKIMS